MTRAAAEPSLEGRRVLVVEDEFLIADELSREVEALGGAVVGPVASVEDARSLVGGSSEVVDLAILDINLGGDMAYALVDDLVGRGISLVLATGYDPESVPERFRALRRWQKPFNPRVLVRELPAVLDGR